MKHHALGDRPGERETTVDAAQWLAILRSCSAFEPFFKRSAHVLSGPSVARFLIFDRPFPRSLLHNLDRARGLLMRPRVEEPPGTRRQSWEVLERFRGQLMQMEIEDVLDWGIHNTLTWIVDTNGELCEAIHKDYLDPPVEALRHSVRVSHDPSFGPVEQSQRPGWAEGPDRPHRAGAKARRPTAPRLAPLIARRPARGAARSWCADPPPGAAE